MQVTARRFVDPKPLFHGTSSTFLRSILVNGLDPALAKKGKWTDADVDKNANYRRPSLKVYGGIYFAGNLLTALSSARNAVEKLGGNRLLICAAIQDRSALPDEDNYNGVQQAFIEAVQSDHETLVMQAWLNIKTKNVGYWGSYRDYFTRFEASIVKKFKLNIDQRRDAHILRQVITNLFIAELSRRMAYRVQEDMRGFTRLIYQVVPSTIVDRITVENADGSTSLNIPRPWMPPNPLRAEVKFRKTLDHFIKMTRTTLYNDDSNFHKSLRLLNPIKFRGRNRITCILEFLPAIAIRGQIGSTQKTYIRLHYGRIPPEFFAEYKARIGDLDRIVFLKRDEQVDGPYKVAAYQGFLNGPEVGDDRPYEWVPDEMMIDKSMKEPEKPKPVGKSIKDKKPPAFKSGGPKNKTKEPAEEEAPAEEKPAKKSSPGKLLTDDIKKSANTKKKSKATESEDDSSEEQAEPAESENKSSGGKSGKSLLTPALRNLLKVK